MEANKVPLECPLWSLKVKHERKDEQQFILLSIVSMPPRAQEAWLRTRTSKKVKMIIGTHRSQIMERYCYMRCFLGMKGE